MSDTLSAVAAVTDLERAREEIQHLKTRIACLEEEQGEMLRAFKQERQTLIQDMEDRLRGTSERLEMEVERRSRELKYMEEQRRELTLEVGRLHMENHRLNDEYVRLQSEIFRLETELGRGMPNTPIQHVSPATPRRDDLRESSVTMANRAESPMMMARIVPHDKKKTAAEAYAELEAAPPKRKPGL